MTIPSDSCPIHLIASANNWIEGEATRQLERAALLPGMQRVVGLPDLHPGKGYPIGAAMISRAILYPFLVGNDIGCGMALWQTELKLRKLRPEWIAERLHGLEDPDADADPEQRLAEFRLPASDHDRWLGTLGGGNHFAELQAIQDVLDPAALSHAGIASDRALLLIHSGSRGLGEQVLREVTERHGAQGLHPHDEAFAHYLGRHDHAVRWAEANRVVLSRRFLEQLRSTGQRLIDLCHNSLVPCDYEGALHWLHRKGAAPATSGLAVIPGSRGTLSYLVQSLNPSAHAAWSLPHGAGRKWIRSQCEGRLAGRFSPRDLCRTPLGSWVICEDPHLLYEESPQAYKNIEAVIQDTVDAGLARVVATLRPLVTYKARRAKS